MITEFGESIPDETVWSHARLRGLVIISKDRDFDDAVRFPGPPPRVVRLLLGNSRTNAVEAYLRANAVHIEQFSRSPERLLEI